MLNFSSLGTNENSWIITINNKFIKNSSFGLFNVFTSVFFAVIILIISSKVKVPLYPVPMTLQPLAVLMIGMLFGRNLTFYTIGSYIFLGLVGLPVFANGGGLFYILGPTGGFIIGFLVAGVFLGELADRGFGKGYISAILSTILGLFLIYFFGILQLSIISGFNYALIKGLYPFILGDAYKLMFASILIPHIWKLTK